MQITCTCIPEVLGLISYLSRTQIPSCYGGVTEGTKADGGQLPSTALTARVVPTPKTRPTGSLAPGSLRALIYSWFWG